MYMVQLMEKYQGRFITLDELTEKLQRHGVTPYQIRDLTKRIRQDEPIWISQSMNWIFVYQGATLICGYDVGKRR
jgi:recombinational DNA repair protein RecR